VTLRYLLDTNIISEPVRPLPNANVMTRLVEAKSTVAIASIVWHEVLLGCYRMPESNRRRLFDSPPCFRLRHLPVLSRESSFYCARNFGNGRDLLD
jgi:tRNA(fMet)-specific endonuclease VapC